MRTKHLIPNHAAGLTYANAHAGAREDYHHAADRAAADPFEGFPDAVLGLIVSKLPFRSAISASSISRRWRGALAAAPSLDLDFPAAFPAAPRRRTAFAAAATAALAPPPPHHHPLRRLRLALDGFFDQLFAASAAAHLAAWLAAAAARGVSHLDLHLPRSRLAVLPPSLLACAGLTSLTLRLDRYALPLPPLGRLTRLSRLRLASVHLPGRDDFFHDLFSQCTLLASLTLEQCHIGALRLAGAPRLRSLDIANCSWDQQSCVGIAEMPSLRTLRYSGAMASRHIVTDAYSLDEVVLATEKPQVKLQGPNLRELLPLVGNARSLVLSPWCIEQFARPGDWSKVRLDKVTRLACIIERREEGALSIAPLLTSCPNVKELSVSVVPSQSKQRRCSGDEVQYDVVCGRGVTVRNLRAIRMEYIDESKSGLELVKLLLKNAQVLETMTIVPSMDGLEQAMFRRRVLKFRKASRNASIQFCASA
ncbi:F-box/LRR-repeat protein At1g06630-like [Lolium rigidum]|uniref:F-box/LRR-repeat protein At1g06630-like n=1 Tax=Lolium rigidum TaxID=89674 RepID=UPI001F5C5482|nr:F-box/LRR-repeat protein At1g06630-like [Lolium rigidum]